MPEAHSEPSQKYREELFVAFICAKELPCIDKYSLKMGRFEILNIYLKWL